MDTTAHEMIKLLLEIVMDLYEANMQQRRYHDMEPNSEDKSVHATATNTVFFAIRAIQTELEMGATPSMVSSSSIEALHHYDMKNLCELLPLAAMYHIKPLTAGKVGFFLANLSYLRENAWFDVWKWMQTTLFAANIQFPIIFRRYQDPHPPLSFSAHWQPGQSPPYSPYIPSSPCPASSGGPARVPSPLIAAIPPPSYPPGFAGRAPSSYPRVHATMPHGFHTNAHTMSDY